RVARQIEIVGGPSGITAGVDAGGGQEEAVVTGSGVLEGRIGGEVAAAVAGCGGGEAGVGECPASLPYVRCGAVAPEDGVAEPPGGNICRPLVALREVAVVGNRDVRDRGTGRGSRQHQPGGCIQRGGQGVRGAVAGHKAVAYDG